MGFDRISLLPDSLLTQILLCIPTKDSVRTSVLSTRWRNIWLSVPGLELHSDDFPSSSKSAIKKFTDRFLELNSESPLQSFKIKYDECNMYLFGITHWFATAIHLGVQHLEVDTLRRPFIKDPMPLDMYKSKTLVSLKLVNIAMLNPESDVHLPCLKIMHLENIQIQHSDGSLIMASLISGCPILEDLTVCRAHDDNVPVLLVRSKSLERLCVRSGPGVSSAYAIEIDSPGVKYIDFRDGYSYRFAAKDLSSLVMTEVDTQFNTELGFTMQLHLIHDFLVGVSSGRHMVISERTLEILRIYFCLKQCLELPIPKFHYLTRLEAKFSNLLLDSLPDFLDMCPNLKHLTMYFAYSMTLEPEDLQLTKVPLCLQSTLDCVEVKEVLTREKTGKMSKKAAMKVVNHKKRIWMEVVRYFLENSEVLKTFILCLTDSDITKELLGFTERTPRCQVIFR